MNRSASRNRPRVWTLSGGRTGAMGSPMTVGKYGLLQETSWRLSIQRAGRYYAQLMSLHMRERLLTANTLYQIADDRIQKIDPKTGQVLANRPDARRQRSFGTRLGRRDALGSSL